MSSSRTPEKILQLGLGFWGSKTLLSAVELQVFTLLGKGSMDAETLREKLAIHPRSARDFFDALVALGMLQREGNLYRNSPEADVFLDRHKPTYVGGLLEMANARLYGFWNSLTEALRTGKPQNESKAGGNPFDSIYSDPKTLASFLGGMTGISLGAGQAIAQKFPWEKYNHFIDVGCAQGAVPVQVAMRHTHLRGGGFDLAVVKPIFEAYVHSHGLAHRIQFHAGDFFRDPLPPADVLIMGHILHDWNIDEKRMLLRKAFDALPAGGALIVYETIIDDDRRSNAFGLLMSLNMLIETPGGFDYTGADCQRWMKETGFRDTRVEHLLGPDSMVIGVK